jgi:Na+/pantothenate symporter
MKTLLITGASSGIGRATALAAARLGAVSFPLGAPATALVIGLGWWLVTPLLLRIELLTRQPAWPALSTRSSSLQRPEV